MLGLDLIYVSKKGLWRSYMYGIIKQEVGIFWPNKLGYPREGL